MQPIFEKHNISEHFYNIDVEYGQKLLLQE